MSYVPKKRGSDERDVDETEDVLDPVDRNAEGKEGNRKNHNKRKEPRIIEVKELVAAIQCNAAVSSVGSQVKSNKSRNACSYEDITAVRNSRVMMRTLLPCCLTELTKALPFYASRD